MRALGLALLLLALAAPAASAATPAAGPWRGEARQTQVTFSVKGRAITGGEWLTAPAPCTRYEVEQATQLLPRIAVGRDGRFAVRRHKARGKVFFGFVGRFTKAGTAVGRLRWFDKRMGCDSGWRRFRATAGLPFRTGAWSGTTAQGEAVRLVVDGSSLALGGTGRDGAPGFVAKVAAACGRPGAQAGVEATTGVVPVGADGAFASRRDLGDLVVDVRGRLDGAAARGTVRVVLRAGGDTCDSGDVAWTAQAGSSAG